MTYKDHAQKLGEQYAMRFRTMKYHAWQGKTFVPIRRLTFRKLRDPREIQKERNIYISEKKFLMNICMHMAWITAPTQEDKIDVVEQRYVQMRDMYHAMNNSGGATTDMFGFLKGTSRAQKQADFSQFQEHFEIVCGIIEKAIMRYAPKSNAILN